MISQTVENKGESDHLFEILKCKDPFRNDPLFRSQLKFSSRAMCSKGPQCIPRAPGPSSNLKPSATCVHAQYDWTTGVPDNETHGGNSSGKEKHMNINKFSELSQVWVGGKNLFMCFFFLFGSFLVGEKKTHKQNPPKNPVECLFITVYVFFSLCVFSLPSSASYLACTPCVPLFCTSFDRCGNRRAFRLPGQGGDHFPCAVDGTFAWSSMAIKAKREGQSPGS